MELAGVKFARPLTHDLLKQVILGLGGRLAEGHHHAGEGDTYYASCYTSTAATP